MVRVLPLSIARFPAVLSVADESVRLLPKNTEPVAARLTFPDDDISEVTSRLLTLTVAGSTGREVVTLGKAMLQL